MHALPLTWTVPTNPRPTSNKAEPGTNGVFIKLRTGAGYYARREN